MAKVKDIPSLIRVLTHNLDFATDQEVADTLITKYYNYEYVFPENADEIESLKAVVNEWAPYCNELYATTVYEYDPIENYNRLEEYWGDDKTTYGKKESRNTDIKEAIETDFKTERNIDTKQAVNAGMRTEHNQNVLTTPDTTETTVHSDVGYDNTVGSESSRDVVTRTGNERVSATANQNYDETTGSEQNNYTHSTTNDETDIHYKTSAPYFRVGMSYNVFYKKPYLPGEFLVGLRYGFTSFSYDVAAPSMTDPTWGAPTIPFSYSGEKSNASWLELSIGLKSNVYKNFYMGLALRYRSRISMKKNENTEPWYIPGYGKNKSTNIGVTYTLVYKLPF